LLLRAGRTAAEIILWAARPWLSTGSWPVLVSVLALARIARLEHWRAQLMERRGVLAVLQLQPQARRQRA